MDEINSTSSRNVITKTSQSTKNYIIQPNVAKYAEKVGELHYTPPQTGPSERLFS